MGIYWSVVIVFKCKLDFFHVPVIHLIFKSSMHDFWLRYILNFCGCLIEGSNLEHTGCIAGRGAGRVDDLGFFQRQKRQVFVFLIWRLLGNICLEVFQGFTLRQAATRYVLYFVHTYLAIHFVRVDYWWIFTFIWTFQRFFYHWWLGRHTLCLYLGLLRQLNILLLQNF